ncbi:hypothetical protein ACH4UM_23570 [Streptomyces sp. NPDC020801]|uniref:hypothetical protein n=1 Tax=unclassified Streptomyces TaxID=2593676 RepID=UPI0037A09C68
MAGLTNALRVHAIRLLTAREGELLALLVIAREENQALRTRRDFKASVAASLIDTDLEGQ